MVMSLSEYYYLTSNVNKSIKHEIAVIRYKSMP